MNIKFITLSSFLTLLSLLTTWGCKETPANDVTIIPLDITTVQAVPIDVNSLIKLETNDSSLIYDVVDLIYANNNYYIESRNMLKIFTNDNGKYVGNLAQEGNNPGEYSSIGRFWIDDDTLKIYDNNTLLQISYSLDGEFLGSKPMFSHLPNLDGNELIPNTFFDAPDKSGYYIKNTYLGSSQFATPQYAYYADGKSNFLLGKTIKSGSHLFDQGFTDYENGRVLTWDALKDTIFSLTPDHVKPIYMFDFGEYKFPVKKQELPDLYDRINTFSNREEGKYISLFRYIQCKGRVIYFSFCSNYDEVGYGSYNEQTKETKLITFYDNSMQYKSTGFIKIIGDSAIISFNDVKAPENNPALYKFKLSEFE